MAEDQSAREVGEALSLKCCNKVCQIIDSIVLLDTPTKTHRLLMVGRCRNPNCGALRAQLVYYDIKEGRFRRETIRSKDVKNVIDYFKSNPSSVLITTDHKGGTRQNQQWIYGITKTSRIGSEEYIEHWACNFNNEKRLIERKKISIESIDPPSNPK